MAWIQKAPEILCGCQSTLRSQHFLLPWDAGAFPFSETLSSPFRFLLHQPYLGGHQETWKCSLVCDPRRNLPGEAEWKILIREVSEIIFIKHNVLEMLTNIQDPLCREVNRDQIIKTTQIFTSPFSWGKFKNKKLGLLKRQGNTQMSFCNLNLQILYPKQYYIFSLIMFVAHNWYQLFPSNEDLQVHDASKTKNICGHTFLVLPFVVWNCCQAFCRLFWETSSCSNLTFDLKACIFFRLAAFCRWASVINVVTTVSYQLMKLTKD